MAGNEVSPELELLRTVIWDARTPQVFFSRLQRLFTFQAYIEVCEQPTDKTDNLEYKGHLAYKRRVEAWFVAVGNLKKYESESSMRARLFNTVANNEPGGSGGLVTGATKQNGPAPFARRHHGSFYPAVQFLPLLPHVLVHVYSS